MNDLLFSVVIPTYNRREMLQGCLDSLATQTLPRDQFEVIVVDDGSTDDTKTFLGAARFSFDLKFLRTENGGPSQARNAGTRIARGTYIAFTEDDVVVAKDWLETAKKYLQQDNLDLLEGSTTYQHSGSPVRRFEKELQHSFIPCNLFIRKSFFDKLGGYDPQFYDSKNRLYFREDAELGFRLLDAGARTQVVRDVIVQHPLQFSSLHDITRHIRRYVFDPLLYKEHPRQFRSMIEVKDIGGITVRRPQHYVALLYCLALVAMSISGVLGNPMFIPYAVVALCCSFAFRYKYQNLRALQLYKLHETIGFLFVPLLYIVTVLRGCLKYKSFGVLL